MDKALAQKWLALQKEAQAIKKDMENPYFKSQYFDVNKVIEEIKPILNKLGLIITQPLATVYNDLKPAPAIKTIIIDADTGSEFSEVTPIPDLPKAQEMGSAITYFRRYALVSMLLLQGEQDDDGNVASGNNSEKKKYPTYIKKANQMCPPRKANFDVEPNVIKDGEELPFN